MKISKRLLFFIPVAAGALLIFTMVSNKKTPSRPELTEHKRQVSVITAEPMTIVPKVKGYGYVRPTETWEALPEVGGKVIEIHPELKKGAFIAEGDVLLRIDPESYGLAESRSEAGVMTTEAQLRELAQQKKNTENLLVIEKEKLRLATQELERIRKLYEKEVISISELEREERELLAQQTAVNNLTNALELIPAQERALIAQKKSGVSSLSESRRDIGKTVIRAPFNCRISEVNIELNEFAQAGRSVITAVNISKVEIPVQLSPTSFSNLISPEVATGSLLEDTGLNMDAIRNLIGISATVRVPLFSRDAEWQGVFKRTSDAIDLDTGALTVYIEVERPYEKVIPSKRPPLVPNLYAEVEMQGTPRENRYVIPFLAIHDGYVHIVDQSSRLQRKKVEVEMVMKNMAIIKEGFTEPLTIITTDLVPAIEGMLLKPLQDDDLMQEVQAIGLTQ